MVHHEPQGRVTSVKDVLNDVPICLSSVAIQQTSYPKAGSACAGMAALANSGSPLNTAYSALATDGYLRASGINAEYSVEHNDTVVTHQWNLA